MYGQEPGNWVLATGILGWLSGKLGGCGESCWNRVIIRQSRCSHRDLLCYTPGLPDCATASRYAIRAKQDGAALGPYMPLK